MHLLSKPWPIFPEPELNKAMLRPGVKGRTKMLNSYRLGGINWQPSYDCNPRSDYPSNPEQYSKGNGNFQKDPIKPQ